MSSTFPPKHRTHVSACGRFLLWEAKRRRLASFLRAKNSKEEASEKGWMAFFLVKRMACGRLRECRSVRREVRREEVLV